MFYQYHEAGVATPCLVLRISVAVDADPDEVDRSSQQLLAELSELDLDGTKLIGPRETPQASEGFDATLGVVVISLSSAGVISAVIEIVWEWLRRRDDDGRSVTLTMGGDTLALRGASDEAQEKLSEAFVSRHGR
jgi:hypothetical protein